ncbi:hypothetical protein LSAT2_010771 [Lamellibrachia satsuma]|nr:hypothetical protein LSAT2_010771 [Lamellibrachia satsuma]
MLKEVNDFKYPGSWVDSTEEDVPIRKGLAWVAANKHKTCDDLEQIHHIQPADDEVVGGFVEYTFLVVHFSVGERNEARVTFR